MKIANRPLDVLFAAVDAAIDSLPPESRRRLNFWCCAPDSQKRDAYEAAKADPLVAVVMGLYRQIGEESSK